MKISFFILVQYFEHPYRKNINSLIGTPFKRHWITETCIIVGLEQIIFMPDCSLEEKLEARILVPTIRHTTAFLKLCARCLLPTIRHTTAFLKLCASAYNQVHYSVPQAVF